MRKVTTLFVVLALLTSVGVFSVNAQSTCVPMFANGAWTFPGCSGAEAAAFLAGLNNSPSPAQLSPVATAMATPLAPNCPTSDEAEAAIFGEHPGLPYLVRVTTEDCTWQTNTYPSVLSGTLPIGWMGTIHIPNHLNADVFVGLDQPFDSWRATFRYLTGFKPGDAVYNACELWLAEETNGQAQVHPFHIGKGNIKCDQFGNVTVDPLVPLTVVTPAPLATPTPSALTGGVQSAG